jgi:hypothetical protein
LGWVVPLTNLADCLEQLGEFDQALHLRRRALDILKATFGPDDQQALQIRERIAEMERDI